MKFIALSAIIMSTQAVKLGNEPACYSLACKSDEATEQYGHNQRQLSESIPACTSLGCKYDTAAPHKKEEDKVEFPGAGQTGALDGDIQHSLKHMGDQEKAMGPWKIDA